MARPCLAGLLLCATLWAAPAAGQVTRGRLVPDVRIGVVDGPPAYTFSGDITLAAGPDGIIYVLDRQQQTVRVFDARGRHVRTMGGEGAGPGEFLGAYALGLRADTLWVNDPMQMRVTLFAPRGSVVRTMGPVVRRSAEHMPAIPEHLLADGSYLVMPSPIEISDGSPRQLLLRVTSQGAVDTIGWPSLRNRMMRLPFPGRTISIPQPWDDSPLVAVAPDGSSWASVVRAAATRRGEGRFRVTRVSARGDTLYSRTYRYTPRPVPAGWRERWVADGAERLSSAARLPRGAAADALRRAVYLPAFMPPVSQVLVGVDGTVWLRREDPQQGESIRWLMLDPAGGISASISGPREMRAMQAQRGAVWGVQWDDLDVAYVVRFRVGTSGSRE